jgi:hypothetical protein
MSGELTADERLVDEKKLFEVEVYKVVYNNALAKLSNRYVLLMKILVLLIFYYYSYNNIS